MNDYIISRETKILMLSIIKAGYYTDQQREQLAKAFCLYIEQACVISDEKMAEIIEKL
jgi:hypothetical protein